MPGIPAYTGSRNGLANTLGSQGKYAEAEAMYRETLALDNSARCRASRYTHEQ
jgi:hypothetical protein